MLAGLTLSAISSTSSFIFLSLHKTWLLFSIPLRWALPVCWLLSQSYTLIFYLNSMESPQMSQNNHKIKSCASFIKDCLSENAGEAVAEGCCLKIIWLLMDRSFFPKFGLENVSIHFGGTQNNLWVTKFAWRLWRAPDRKLSNTWGGGLGREQE